MSYLAERSITDVKVAFALGAARGVIASGEDLLARSVQDAPVETGELRASARLEYLVDREVHQSSQVALRRLAEKIRGGESPRFSVRVSFNEVYAARQHEEITWNHPQGGRSKYLEHNVLEMAPRYKRVIEASAKKALRGESTR